MKKSIVMLAFFVLSSTSFAESCVDKVQLLKALTDEECRPVQTVTHGCNQYYIQTDECKTASKQLKYATRDCLNSHFGGWENAY